MLAPSTVGARALRGRATTPAPPPAAAMGPVGAGGVTDLVDFYIGKGPLGPTILPASVKGWWYLHQ